MSFHSRSNIKILTDMSYSGSVGRQTIGSLGSSEDSTTGSLKKPSFSERHPKAVRSVTVIGYLFCVSLAAIILSAYYVALWKPSSKELPKNYTSTLPFCVTPGNVSTTNANYFHNRRSHSSRYTHSRLQVIIPAATPHPLPPIIPEPSKLVSPPINSEPIKQLNLTNNSLPENNSSAFPSPTDFVPMERNSNSSAFSPKMRGTVEPVKEEDLQSQQASTYDYNVAESTFLPSTPSPSTRPNSIILQKILLDRKKVDQLQEHIYR